MSKFVVILLVALIAGAMAFRAPTRFGNAATKVATKSSLAMSPADIVVDTTDVLSKFTQLSLAAEGDFGGYAGPAGSLLLIGFLILTLSPPLEQKGE
mmetsp:Transcript_1161/g.1887  ORF Transcript_1161/g.1887 Transcript_1161/m.1887 type:complete len:97 (-) Transcript_1161:237-527(-)